MGNRAVITTEENWNSEPQGVGVYLHWNGGRDSVEGFLTYCKLRGFRPPEHDCYGWARLVQIITNFFGGDGTSIGIDKLDRLDCDNYDNGVYLIRDWEIVGRRYFEGEEQSEYKIEEMLIAIDEAQPESQRIGARTMQELYTNKKSLNDLHWNYHYKIKEDKEKGLEPQTIKVGSVSTRVAYEGRLKVLDRDESTVTVSFNDGEPQTIPIYHWKDGSESVIFKCPDGREMGVHASDFVMGSGE